MIEGDVWWFIIHDERIIQDDAYDTIIYGDT